MVARFSQRSSGRSTSSLDKRVRYLAYLLGLLLVAVVIRLAYLQIVEHETYAVLASDQHDLQAKLWPTRGRIFVRDSSDQKLYPLATNRDAWTVYAVPRGMKDPVAIAQALAPLLTIPDVDLITKFTKNPDDPYEPISKNVTTELMEQIREKHLDGIGLVKMSARLYPEKGVGGQLLGFVRSDEDQHGLVGKYGIEGAFNDLLQGTAGSIFAEKDAGGRRLPIGDTRIQAARDGSDIVLTIDRTIQYETCLRVREAVLKHQADAGSIVIMDPNTGAILAMCSYPDFDPAEYGKIQNLSVLNNPVVFGAYEPGSIFKSFTMAAGLHAGKITPKTTYTDTGLEVIDDRPIRNSDKKAHGLVTMTEALDESLNTATIFVQRLLTKDVFRSYVEAFGFGKKTGIEVTPESKGDVTPLSRKGSVFAATASYGQGITVTPLQTVAAYGALANGGKLMKPYVVAEIIHPDGSRERTRPQEIARPIDARASRLISGMLVSVVENGHGKGARVPGYWVAGKTGTAQVARKDGPGYEEGTTIGSFAGYAPASDPRFVMLVKIDHPRDIEWAESSAGPLFGDMAKFLLHYFHVPPERPLKDKPPEPLPETSVSTTTN